MYQLHWARAAPDARRRRHLLAMKAYLNSSWDLRRDVHSPEHLCDALMWLSDFLLSGFSHPSEHYSRARGMLTRNVTRAWVGRRSIDALLLLPAVAPTTATPFISWRHRFQQEWGDVIPRCLDWGNVVSSNNSWT